MNILSDLGFSSNASIETLIQEAKSMFSDEFY